MMHKRDSIFPLIANASFIFVLKAWFSPEKSPASDPATSQTKSIPQEEAIHIYFS